MPVKFVEYDRSFLLASRRWLRDPEIAALTVTPEFTDEAQERWYASFPQKLDYAVWGVMLESDPIGVVGLKNIESERSEYFGYLGEKRFWGAGHGGDMLTFALDKAKARGCKVVYLRVWVENHRAIALYRRHGFDVVREAQAELYMERHV